MSLRLIILSLMLGLACVSAMADTVHTVRKSETLYSISQNYSVSINNILKSNPGLDPHKIRVGQRIHIPDGKEKTSAKSNTTTPPPSKPATTDDSNTYIAEEGDTVTSVAKQFKIPVEELKARNDLTKNTLTPGQKLILKENAPPPAPSAPAAVGKMDFKFLTKNVLSKINSPNNLRAWKYIVVHHSGTPNGNAKIFDYFHSHFRGMENGLAYHFVIGNGSDSGDGEIEIGNRWLKQLQGGHLHSDELNEISIGICLVGDFNKKSPSKAQIASLIELITYLEKKCASSHPKFCIHREINPTPTECPGKLFPARTLHNLFD